MLTLRTTHPHKLQIYSIHLMPHYYLVNTPVNNNFWEQIFVWHNKGLMIQFEGRRQSRKKHASWMIFVICYHYQRHLWLIPRVTNPAWQNRCLGLPLCCCQGKHSRCSAGVCLPVCLPRLEHAYFTWVNAYTGSQWELTDEQQRCDCVFSAYAPFRSRFSRQAETWSRKWYREWYLVTWGRKGNDAAPFIISFMLLSVSNLVSKLLNLLKLQSACQSIEPWVALWCVHWIVNVLWMAEWGHVA